MDQLLEFVLNNAPMVLVGAGGLGAFLLYLNELRGRHDEIKRQQQIMDLAKEKSFEVISGAVKKSEDILSNAELDAIKATAANRLNTQKFEQKLEGEMAAGTEQAEKDLSTHIASVTGEIDAAKDEFVAYLKQLQTTLHQAHNTTQQQLANALNDQTSLVRAQINDLFEKFEQNLSQFLIQTQQQSVDSIETELRATRQLIDTYKTQQLHLIDENIIAMLEKTLSLVLTKKLTLKDHVELVYESLEKAKIEKFIV